MLIESDQILNITSDAVAESAIDCECGSTDLAAAGPVAATERRSHWQQKSDAIAQVEARDRTTDTPIAAIELNQLI